VEHHLNKQDHEDDDMPETTSFDSRKSNAMNRIALSSLGTLRAHGADCAILMFSSQDEHGHDRMFRFRFGSSLMQEGLFDNYARILDAERSEFADNYVASDFRSVNWSETFDDPTFRLSDGNDRNIDSDSDEPDAEPDVRPTNDRIKDYRDRIKHLAVTWVVFCCAIINIGFALYIVASLFI
jgi:hypothetical protein